MAVNRTSEDGPLTDLRESEDGEEEQNRGRSRCDGNYYHYRSRGDRGGVRGNVILDVDSSQSCTHV